jgi:hypothetical protein
MSKLRNFILTLKEIENRLMNYVPNTGSHDDLANSTIREEFEVETINLESARVFRQYGGIEVNFNLNIKLSCFWKV